MRATILVGADTLVELEDLVDATDNSAIADATVTFTLKDSAGNAISGATAVAMTYAASNANSRPAYQGILDGSVSLIVGETYIVEITANTNEGFWRLMARADYNRAA